MVDVDSNFRKKLDVSLHGGVSCLEFSTCGRYIMSASNGSRELLIFDIQENADLKPRYVISLNGTPKLISTKTYMSRVFMDVFCIFDGISNGGCIVRVFLDEASPTENETILKCSLNCKVSLLCGCFGSLLHTDVTGTSSGITLAIGQDSNPYFKYVDFETSDGFLIENIDIEIDNNLNGINIEENHSSNIDVKGDSANEKILGPLDAGGIKRPAMAENTLGSNKRNKESTASEVLDNNNIEFVLDLESAEKTLEQRLDELNNNLTQYDQDALIVQKSSSSITIDGVEGVIHQTPTSDSLVTLVEQALQSSDNSLLEQCLGIENDNIIEETCKRLPTNRVISFLKKLVSKFEKSPMRGILLTKWLSSLLRNHTSFLMSVPDLTKQLSGLSQILENRLATYSRLSSLSGRLDLLMGQWATTTTTDNSDDVRNANNNSSKSKQIYIED